MVDFSLSSAIAESIAGLPYAIASFGASLVLYTLALAAYVATAPFGEFRLVREGNRAAACSLAGAMLGLALPIASIILVSGSLLDMLVWSVVALVLQLVAVGVLRRMVPELSARVAQGEWASGAFLGMFAVVVGLLNAAAMAM